MNAAYLKAGPGFAATKLPLLNDTHAYGYFDPGTKEEPRKAPFYFGGRYGNITLSYDVFDVDTDGEVIIKLNRKVVAAAPVTGDNKWSGPHTVDLPGNIINDLTRNTLEFNQTVKTGTEEWGIRNVTLVAKETTVDLTMITLIGNREDIGGRDSHTIHAKLLAQELNSYQWPSENLSIGFTTKFPQAWEKHLNFKLNETNTNLYWSSDRTETDFYVTTTHVDGEYYLVTMSIMNVNKFNCRLAVVRLALS